MKSIFILHEGDETKAIDAQGNPIKAKKAKINDNQLIRLLLENLKLDASLVEFQGMGSKLNFFEEKNYSDLIKQGVQTNQVKKILFVVDADNVENNAVYGGFENTKNALNKIIRDLKWEDISDVFIIHEPNKEEGNLESMLLATLPEEKRNCITEFINCSKMKPNKHFYKTIIGGLYTIAYPEPPYNFDHEHFDELKEKLMKLFEKKEEQVC